MDKPFDPSNPLPQKYEIAQPLTYAAFPVDSAQKQSAQQQTTSRSEKGPHEQWSDTGKEFPTVKAKDVDKFAPPNGDGDKTFGTKEVTREMRAVWIVHGMGQQIPFETLDSLTHGLLDVIRPQASKPRLRTVKIGDQVLQRVELDIDGQAARYELHLYESYWAPKTEGVAKLTDVVSFLWDGGLRGLLNSVKDFQRAMFGGMALFSIPFPTPVWLCMALLILAALTVINGVILTAAAAQSGLPFSHSMLLKAHWNQLTALASCMIAVAFTFGNVLFLAAMSKPQELKKAPRLLLGLVSWAAMIIAVWAILKTAFLMAVITHFDWVRGTDHETVKAPDGTIARIRESVEHFLMNMPSEQLQGFATIVILSAGVLVGLAMTTRAILRSSETPLRGHWALLSFSLLSFVLNLIAIAGPVWIWRGGGLRGTLPAYLGFLQSPLWVWPFLIAFSAKVRAVMVQYVGDVAIYVRPNKLDRFDEVRSKIKEAARSVASAVFTAYKPGTTSFLYDKVAVVGHSLGSVIAYDTLNRLMLDDWLSNNALGMAERTQAMVTFGSPLNKTAFLFTIQGKDSLHIRERLACTVQPLIMSYPKFRKLNWINVYSRNDIISGPLKFYDLPGFQDPPSPAVAVRNVVDKDAAVPLVAHVAYWKNKTVWKELLLQIAP